MRISLVSLFLASLFLIISVRSAVAHLYTPVVVKGSLSYTGIDVMKWTKDTIAHQPSDATIEAVVSAIMDTINPEYIAISIPMDSNEDFLAHTTPSPRTVEAFTQKIADSVRAHGGKVLWRGTWSGIEGIYNFPKLDGADRLPAGTAASAATDGDSTWLGKTYNYIIDHPSFFDDGDIWAPLPERTEGIFSDSTSFLPATPPGLQANYANFFNDLKTVSDQAFSQIGVSMITGLTANNFSEINSGWMYQSVIDTAGLIVIDHYGVTHTPEEMEADLRRIYSQRGYPVFLQEWGDYWNAGLSSADRLAYLTDMYTMFQRLVDDGVLVGFNYWGAWVNNLEGILSQNGGTFQVNERGLLVRDFFAGWNQQTEPPADDEPPVDEEPPADNTTPADEEPPADDEPPADATPPVDVEPPVDSGDASPPDETPDDSGSTDDGAQSEPDSSGGDDDSNLPGNPASPAVTNTEPPAGSGGSSGSYTVGGDEPPTAEEPFVAPGILPTGADFEEKSAALQNTATEQTASAPSSSVAVQRSASVPDAEIEQERPSLSIAGFMTIALEPLEISFGTWKLPTQQEMLASMETVWPSIRSAAASSFASAAKSINPIMGRVGGERGLQLVLQGLLVILFSVFMMRLFIVIGRFLLRIVHDVWHPVRHEGSHGTQLGL